MAAGVGKAAADQKASKASSSVYAAAADYALKALYQYTAARRPSRTLVDPLDAFTQAYAKSQGKDLDGAVKAAVDAADETRTLVAKAGRAAYVGQDELRKADVPDAGAFGIGKILQGLASA